MTSTATTENIGRPTARLAYTKAEACSALGISPTTLWRLEKRGLLRPVKHLRTLLYPLRELERFLATEKGGLNS